MKEITVICFFIQLFVSNCIAKDKFKYVTYGSMLKLYNSKEDVRLHSHDVKYGSGSGLQSVTGSPSRLDHNSYWIVKGKHGKALQRGEIIKCGDEVRLEHLNTKRNLHSHSSHRSPMSREQEVCAYGDNGEGDNGDNWIVKCNTKYWNRKNKVRFKHAVTRDYLHVSSETFGRPIAGQHEIFGRSYDDDRALWIADDGVYVKEKNPKK